MPTWTTTQCSLGRARWRASWAANPLGGLKPKTSASEARRKLASISSTRYLPSSAKATARLAATVVAPSPRTALVHNIERGSPRSIRRWRSSRKLAAVSDAL